ncbi:MAG: hypothetical protein SPC89_06010 [Candidatus Methanarcanum hacksteinii]|uniref:hypothetical protein n=1 Tax=Candidatus Methanarcanum hacksteinii TaxID=2911857 RepID=UPI0026F5CAFA|nr:hypothetical protein [Methanomassiliicoccales archaeon]MDY4580975.1 hypothetical protein [Candidatus Methanarcanum hacksteinii]TQS78281.1 MAG: hypothetical protein A3204_04380 [Candidatus Methanarcanum hacksteinii]
MIDSIFEILMLLCFATAWPFSIIKQLRTKRTEGKSILFSYIVLAGYLFGFINKIVMDEINYVIYFYILDFALVLFDIILYYRYRPKDNVMPITA